MTRAKATALTIKPIDFIQGIFGSLSEEAKEKPVFCGFPGDPAHNESWKPAIILDGRLPTSIAPTNNCYTSLATFLPDEEGKYRAKKQQVAANYAILLDDIGTKAKKELPIHPSWKIETSPGNYQVGFILKTPCKNPEKYGAVVTALVKAGWGDRGASGVARWARLPCGVNGKEKYVDAGVAPKVRLVKWHPHRRYSLKKITMAFELQLEKGPKPDVAIPNGKGGDAVLSALKAARMWKRELEPGKHEITCPWVSQHTDQVDHGAVYFGPTQDNKHLGGFVCQHDHCSTRNIADLKAFLGLEDLNKNKGALETALEVIESQMQVFQDENGEPFGFIEGHCLPLKNRDVKAHMMRKVHAATGKALKQGIVTEVLATLESKALVEGEKRKLHNRIALHEGKIWYDLGDGRVVKVKPKKWTIVDAPPLFRRYRHQQDQVTPEPGGNVWELFKFLNIAKAHRLETMVLLISYLVPDIAHPIFHPHGAQGGGKTTLCKMIKKLLDPSSLDILLAPKDKQELIRLITRHHIPLFDNMSRLDSEMSDILCMACTGGSIARRVLFTDDDDYIYSFRRCCGLNGINLLITKPDLLDRTMLLQLDRIPPENRKEESQLWHDFEEAKPGILGGMFDVLAKALSIYPRVKLECLPRMADFATWGYAIAEGLKTGNGEKFLTAYKANVRRQNQEVLQNNSLCLAIKLLMKDKEEWEGTVKKAFTTLYEIAEPSKTDHSFPADPKNLRKHLERIQTTLAESENITYRFTEKPRKDGYYITFTKS